VLQWQAEPPSSWQLHLLIPAMLLCLCARVGTCWVNGSIPQAISKMQNLTVLNLGNNWFHGTLPSFLADLPLLRVLNLGSQFGGNDGSDLPGLLGTIPAGVKQLGYLRELVLEANSLSGQLPKGLCHNGEPAIECMQ